MDNTGVASDSEISQERKKNLYFYSFSFLSWLKKVFVTLNMSITECFETVFVLSTTLLFTWTM